MSNPDSFIDEVNEEVRRDRLYAAFRKYGWIGILAVLGIVGGAAWNEWQKSQSIARAEAFGDAVMTALEADAPDARRTALAAVPATGEQTAVLQLLMASDPAEDKVGTLAALDVLASDAAQPQVYRDLAVLRRVIIAGADMPAADRAAALDGIAAAGRPFRTLALEQKAYLAIEAGDNTTAIADLTALLQDQEAPSGLRARVEQMIIALGGTVAPAVPADQG